MSGRYSIVPGDPRANRDDVLALATRNRPGPPSRLEAKYRKYYERNPFGAPSIFLARDNETGNVVGMTALIPTALRTSGELVPAAIGGDFAVDEEHRTLGPAVALQRATVPALAERRLACAYGSPNTLSEPIVARAGYTDLGRLSRFLKLLSARPVVDRYVRSRTLAALASGAARPVVSLASRERLQRRSRRFSIDRPDRFDGRFARLWEAIHGEPGLTSDRSADVLNWRYEKDAPAEATREYSIFALLDGGDVAAYAVYLTDHDSRVVYDLLSLPERPVLDALLGEFIRDSRRSGARTIDLGYVGPPNPLTRRLRAFGFIERSAQNGLLVCAAADTTPAVDLTRRGSWHFLTGDTDV